MDLVAVVNFLLIAGVIQGFGFNLVTIFVKKKIVKAIVYLNLVVLFITLNNLQRWLMDSGFSSNLFVLKHLLIPWYLLIFPMFYAFTSHFLKIENKVVDFVKPTLIIFVLEIVIRLCMISYVYYEVPNQNDTLITIYTTIEDIFNLVYCIFIFVNASILIFRRHEMLKCILAYDDLKWLKLFIRLGVFVVLLWAVAVVLKSSSGNEMAYIPLRFSTSILLYWIGYQGFYKYNVVQDRIFLRHKLDTGKVLISTESSLQSVSIIDDSCNEKHQLEYERIKHHILDRKLYLDPLLGQEKLSLDLGLSKSHISKLINSYSNCNFSDFINALRVEQAKKFLSDSDFSDYTIVAIGLECGFNSKSTFYSAFKKFTSKTPTTFRDQF